MARRMKQTREGPYTAPEREEDANYAIHKEFICFMAKRTNKQKATTERRSAGTKHQRCKGSFGSHETRSGIAGRNTKQFA
jgi:hypothetical protein